MCKCSGCNRSLIHVSLQFLTHSFKLATCIETPAWRILHMLYTRTDADGIGPATKKACTCWALLAHAIACKEGKIVATRSFNCFGVLVQGMSLSYQKFTFTGMSLEPRIDLWLQPSHLKLQTTRLSVTDLFLSGDL